MVLKEYGHRDELVLATKAGWTGSEQMYSATDRKKE
ncbi:hypothetical protein [Sporolactobacillus mangiferae]|nr:hypothetical protein [Sporolactobacillus mangiferae]